MNLLRHPSRRRSFCVFASLAAAIGSAFAQSAPAALPSQPVEYVNPAYGLRVHLPDSWRGFTVLIDSPLGTQPSSGQSPADRYATITLRDPLWTATAPREDIPIIIFTLKQWVRVQNETLFVSAAPIPPSKLTQNRVYVFALPPRYDFDDRPGLDEVHAILASQPFEPFTPKRYPRNKAK